MKKPHQAAALMLCFLACGSACAEPPGTDESVRTSQDAPSRKASSGDPAVRVSDDEPGRLSLHVQSTFIWQRKYAFSAPFTGPQSISTVREQSHTWSATGFLGARLGKNSEVYLNPESVAGVPFSSFHGLGSVSNGDLQKNGGPHPHEYVARIFVRHTANLGGNQLRVEDGPNQLASVYDRRRFVLTAGKVTQTDIFEKSSYANDPRSQFLNWALITHGAWDYAGDARAYTVGVAAEFYWDAWVVRAGRFMEPKIANGPSLNYQIARFHGDQLELEHNHVIADRPGTIRFLVFRNRAFAGRYRDAVNAALASGDIPDVTAVRHDATKLGFAVSAEQKVASDLGVFLRASTADGRVEEYAFAEIDNTVSGGISLQGDRWRRPADTLGLAFATSGLSRDHRDYLAAGGLGGFLGDGQLPRYGRENVIEAYYRIQVAKALSFSFDLQQISNPGYNASRHGPIRILGGRLHVEI